MIAFKNATADSIQLGDIMRQAEEHKRHTDLYHYRATAVFNGDITIAIHDADGQFIGNRIEQDVVEIEWTPIEEGRPFTRRYAQNATVELASTPVTDTTQLITHTQHNDEI
jgi:uncharacterized protein YcbX